jgi:MFS family permease
LIAASLGGSLVFAKAALVNVALARIGRDLALAPSEMQWVVNAELLPLAALTLVAGAIGDRFGEKRIFLWGVLVFLLGAVISAIAPNWWVLVGARFLQGLGDALILPNALSILGRAFPRETKTLAVGIWSAIGAAMSAAAPAVTGWILSEGSWRETFMIPISVALIAFLVGAVWVPRSATNAEISIDYQGAALSIIGLGCFGWALTGLTSDAKGENPLILVGVLVIALLALAALVVMEGRRGDKAMLPPSLFASRSVVGANLFTFLLYGCLNVIFTLLPFVMIRGAGLSSLVAGLAFVPMA